MRSLIWLSLAIFISGSVFAQHPGYEPVKNQEAFRQVFQDASKKTNSIRCDFVQEKNLSLLSDKITSRGKFWFEKDNRVRMEYSQPFIYLMILNQGKIYVKDGQKENKISANSSKVFQQINRIMLDCVGGTVLTNPDFSPKVWEAAKSYLLELTPVAKNLHALYSRIVVVIDKKDFTATSLEMTEVSGDSNLIRFVNKELNAPLSPALFAIN